jgi:hypothetical protein
MVGVEYAEAFVHFDLEPSAETELRHDCRGHGLLEEPPEVIYGQAGVCNDTAQRPARQVSAAVHGHCYALSCALVAKRNMTA